MDQVGLDSGSRHEQAARDLRISQMLADQAHHIQLARGQARPAGARAFALAAAPDGVGDRLLHRELRALGPRGCKLVGAEGVIRRRDSSFVGAAVDWEASVTELRSTRLCGGPEANRFLITVLLRGQSGQQLQGVDYPQLIAGSAAQVEGLMGERLRLLWVAFACPKLGADPS